MDSVVSPAAVYPVSWVKGDQVASVRVPAGLAAAVSLPAVIFSTRLESSTSTVTVVPPG
ncbi:hypothetical protein [Streptomyces sp. URMC 125]|uniref:hypothetical protein n=1 Tax=Streptomyces sp. URMC 125 TaxID=3423419 RepID=UPI003F1DAB05